MKYVIVLLFALCAQFGFAADINTETDKASSQLIEQYVSEYFQQKESYVESTLLASEPSFQHRRRCRDDDNGDGDRLSCIDAACARMPSSQCNEHSDIEVVGRICRGVEAECLKKVCDRMPSSKCNEHSDLQRVGDSCRRIDEHECIEAACDRMPSSQCNEHSDIEQVAAICENGVEAACINAVCDRLPSSQCNEHSDLLRVARGCRGED